MTPKGRTVIHRRLSGRMAPVEPFGATHFDGSGVRLANLLHGGRCVLSETGLWIRTEQRKVFCLTELMPETFESNGCRLMILRPKKSHHLSEGPDTAAVLSGEHEQVLNGLIKKFFVRPSLDQELRKRGLCVTNDVLQLPTRIVDVDPACPQSRFKSLSMRWRGDHNDPVSRPKSAGDETFQCIQKGIVISRRSERDARKEQSRPKSQ